VSVEVDAAQLPFLRAVELVFLFEKFLDFLQKTPSRRFVFWLGYPQDVGRALLPRGGFSQVETQVGIVRVQRVELHLSRFPLLASGLIKLIHIAAKQARHDVLKSL
jgi:hypothetical protein